MAAERKLKTEIDKCFKKVAEGQEDFEVLWNQLHACDNGNQREKLEGELKKEIKKLQRLREQIKGWIANADIKDKQPLLDARKNIERDMERFKVCEREMKMAGRAGMPKALDPKDRAKEEAREWINQTVETLTEKVEMMEAELEDLQGNTKKNKKPPPRMQELEDSVKCLKNHIGKLEKLLRCIDNETINSDELEQLKSDFEYYLADDAEDNGVDITAVEDMYQDFADRLEQVDQAVATVTNVHARGMNKNNAEAQREREKAQAEQLKKQAEQKEDEDRKAAAAAIKAPPPSTAAPAVTSPQAASAMQRAASGVPEKADAAAATNGNAAAAGPITPRGNIAAEPGTVAGGVTPVSARAAAQPAQSAFPAAQAGQTPGPAGRMGGPGQPAGPGAAPPGIPAPAGSVWMDGAGAAGAPGAGRQNFAAAAKLQAGPPPPGIPPPGIAPPTQQQQPQPGAVPPGARPPPGMAPPGPRGPVGAPPGYGQAGKGPGEAGDAGMAADGDGNAVDAAAKHLKGLELDGADGAAGPRPALLPPQGPLENPHLPPVMPAYSAQAAKQILEACFVRAHPQPSDTDLRAYRPRHPAPTPPSYPRMPHENTEHPSLFRKMDPECLFFAFYFQPDTYQQFLAAHELKRQSWRFHKQHNAWFQRFTEPNVTNEEFEQGAYVYFDYNVFHDDMQTGWCYRRKENFTFRYDALEDELRPAPPPPGAS